MRQKAWRKNPIKIKVKVNEAFYPNVIMLYERRLQNFFCRRLRGKELCPLALPLNWQTNINNNTSK